MCTVCCLCYCPFKFDSVCRKTKHTSSLPPPPHLETHTLVRQRLDKKIVHIYTWVWIALWPSDDCVWWWRWRRGIPHHQATIKAEWKARGVVVRDILGVGLGARQIHPKATVAWQAWGQKAEAERKVCCLGKEGRTWGIHRVLVLSNTYSACPRLHEK